MRFLSFDLRSSTFVGVGLLFALALAGCKLSPPPDPNDPNDVRVLQADVLERNLRWASMSVNDRVVKGEITIEQGNKILADQADRLLKSVRIKEIPPADAWKYGDLFKTAKWWAEAEIAYDIAVKHAIQAKNEDRRVNDSLHLAQAQANLGDVDAAIKSARSTFTAKPEEKAPILMSVLYEIVPAAQGKMRDKELAQLLADAAEQHDQVIVDANSESGKNFLSVKMHHLSSAWARVAELYEKAGERDAANKAREKLTGLLADKQRL